MIVQGRYDLVTPVATAWQLSKLWPNAPLEIVPDAGHAMTEPGIVDRLVRANTEVRADRIIPTSSREGARGTCDARIDHFAAVVAVALIILAILMIATIPPKASGYGPRRAKGAGKTVRSGRCSAQAWVGCRSPRPAGGFERGAVVAAIADRRPADRAGFGITFYGYFDLGIENTYGADESLVTDGLYRYSRNPQYVASIIGYLGIGALPDRGSSGGLSRWRC